MQDSEKPVEGVRRALKGDHNQCPTCGEYFNSTRAFDKHRTGEHPSLKKGTPSTRRCMSEEEMFACGMDISNSGWWVSKKLSTGDIQARGKKCA